MTTISLSRFTNIKVCKNVSFHRPACRLQGACCPLSLCGAALTGLPLCSPGGQVRDCLWDMESWVLYAFEYCRVLATSTINHNH